MVTASQGVGLPRKLFGFDFNDGHVGLGGLTSAVITCYQLFPPAQKKWELIKELKTCIKITNFINWNINQWLEKVLFRKGERVLLTILVS